MISGQYSLYFMLAFKYSSVLQWHGRNMIHNIVAVCLLCTGMVGSPSMSFLCMARGVLGSIIHSSGWESKRVFSLYGQGPTKVHYTL